MTDVVELETWQSETRGLIGVRRWAQDGSSTVEPISAGKKFHISPAERIRNQDQVARAEYDPFTNGMFTPVKLIESAEDLGAVSSPNQLSETELTELLEGNWKPFDKRVGEITSTVTLERMLAVAEESDLPVKRSQRVKERLDEITAPKEAVDKRPNLPRYYPEEDK